MDQKTVDFDWVEAALSALHRTTGIPARIRRGRREGAASPVAAVSLRRGTVTYRYAVECRRSVRTAADLSVVRAQLAARDPGLLVTTYLTPALAGQCREMGLQFIDTAGNTYLDAPDLFVFVSGQTPPDSVVRPTVRISGNPSSQRMVFALLCEPALLQATYREIARVSGIALGSVGAVFNGLAARGWLLETRQEERRRLTAPDRLLDEWVTNYPTILRHRLQPRRFSAPNPEWWRSVGVVDLGASWGGEVAAESMVGGLRPEWQTLYVFPSRMAQAMQGLTQKHKLRPNPEGAVEVLEAFWDPSIDKSAGAGLVPPVLVYADLMATLSAADLEVAAQLRKGIIKDVLDQF
ncbi:type IV toxin-antitoxin system AbiEi family antitoxin [Cupriavidus sp. RAF12]|uniref:type IV toxin-antitoxin system AbiEi family antitoxin n=1 Tax=Cupriavidus sp. RAF12 TaxID=3233050 RepID=UPI003F90B2CF